MKGISTRGFASILKDTSTTSAGSALIEFAFLIPILILCAAGVIQFGKRFTDYTQMVESARIAARTAAGYQGSESISCVTKSMLRASLHGAGKDPSNYNAEVNEVNLKKVLETGRADNLVGIELKVTRSSASSNTLSHIFSIPAEFSTVFFIEKVGVKTFGNSDICEDE